MKYEYYLKLHLEWSLIENESQNGGSNTNQREVYFSKLFPLSSGVFLLQESNEYYCIIVCVELADWLASRVAKSSSYFARHWVCTSGAYVIYVEAVLVAKRVPPGSQLSALWLYACVRKYVPYGTLQSPWSLLLGGMYAISFSLALGNIFLGSTRLKSLHDSPLPLKDPQASHSRSRCPAKPAP